MIIYFPAYEIKSKKYWGYNRNVWKASRKDGFNDDKCTREILQGCECGDRKLRWISELQCIEWKINVCANSL